MTTLQYILIGACGLLLLSACIVVWFVARAVIGWQDKDEFHFGEK